MKSLYLFLSFLCCFSLQLLATEVEPNDNAAQANPFTLNSTETGVMTGADVDWFSITVGSDGRLSVQLTSTSSAAIGVSIIGSDGTTVLANATTTGPPATISTIVAPGTYYVKAYPVYGDARSNGSYTLSNQLDGVSETEPNGTPATADILPLNGFRTGYAAGHDPEQYLCLSQNL